jgi:hypothetical protein
MEQSSFFNVASCWLLERMENGPRRDAEGYHRNGQFYKPTQLSGIEKGLAPKSY